MVGEGLGEVLGRGAGRIWGRCWGCLGEVLERVCGCVEDA